MEHAAAVALHLRRTERSAGREGWMNRRREREEEGEPLSSWNSLLPLYMLRTCTLLFVVTVAQFGDEKNCYM